MTNFFEGDSTSDVENYVIYSNYKDGLYVKETLPTHFDYADEVADYALDHFTLPEDRAFFVGIGATVWRYVVERPEVVTPPARAVRDWQTTNNA